MKTRLSRRKKILFALTVVLVFLLIVEGAVRLFEPESLTVGPQRISPIDLPPKPENVRRVLFFGGSTVEGYPEPRLGIVAQYEWLLSGDGSVEVHNLGISGAPALEVYRRVRSGIENKPDLLVVMTGHNEFLTPDLDDSSLIMDGLFRHIAMIRVARYAYTQFLFKRQIANFQKNRHVVMEFPEDSAVFRRKVEIYENAIDRITRLAREKRVPIILATMPANLRDWRPSFPNFAEEGTAKAYDSLARAAEEAFHGGDLEATRSNVAAIRERFGDGDPLAAFWLGKVALAEGDLEEAERLLRLAKESDPALLRVLDRFNDYVRSKADPVNNVHVVDVENLVGELAESKGLPGLDMLYDNCHPGSEAAFAIASALASETAAILASPMRAATSEDYLKAATLADAGDPVYFELALKNALYCMRLPWLQFRHARNYLDEAKRLRPDDWRIPVNLATIELMEGNEAAAIELLIEALDLRGDLVNGAAFDLYAIDDNPGLALAIYLRKPKFEFKWRDHRIIVDGTGPGENFLRTESAK